MQKKKKRLRSSTYLPKDTEKIMFSSLHSYCTVRAREKGFTQYKENKKNSAPHALGAY